MHKQLRRTWIEVDLDAISANIRVMKRMLSPGTAFMAVVKADAYSHGAPLVAKVLDGDEAVACFGVSSFDEAMQIRRCQVEKAILILGYTPPYLTRELVQENFSQTVYSLEYAQKLNDALEGREQKLKIHIKIDTGMSRLGIVCHQEAQIPAVLEQVQAIARLPNLEAEGIYTHFADSDNLDTTFCDGQFQLMRKLLQETEGAGLSFRYCHACNSGGVEYHGSYELGLVRSGLMMYGYSQHAEIATAPLQPAMQLKSIVTQIKSIEKGATVSYSRTFRAEQDMRIAVVSIGYADGYSRDLSGKAEMLINGKRAKVLGLVCMDQTVVDITHIPHVEEGQVVTIFGTDHGETLWPEELAAHMGGTVYTVLCGLGIRVPRVYLRDGEEFDVTNYINT